GDSIASALMGAGVRVLSRSFKYHRPRGVLTMAGQDANTLVQLPGAPNVLADRTPVREGLEVRGQNYRGSLENDRLMILDRFARFMPVGFYYKTFFKPGLFGGGSWRRWEPRIRAMAGLGVVDQAHHHGYFDKQYLFHDVVVVGGGAAGMSAALKAADAGADTLLVDENPVLGGALSYARFGADAGAGRAQMQALAAKVAAQARITVMTDAACQGWFADNWLPVIRGNRMYKIRAKAVVVATGSMEQPMVFRHNDLPGIMLGSAAQRLIRHYGVRPGTRAVVAAANSDGYGVALDLLDAGIEVAAIVDLRLEPGDDEVTRAALATGVTVVPGFTPWQSRPGSGMRSIAGIEIARITGEGTADGEGHSVACDLLCLSTGYSPAAHLLYNSGAQLEYDDATAMMAIRSLPEHVFACGSVNGVFDPGAVVQDGARAGWAAAQDVGLDAGPQPVPANRTGAEGQTHPWPIFKHPKGKDFVDFDEDLQVKDILNAMADGYDHIELVKRYSTVGMGPSQGRHSAVTTMRLVAKAQGLPPAAVGTTTSRPPYLPETFGHLAGRGFEPVRHTAMHHRHLEAGAQMMPAGLWLRPAYYGRKDERDAAIAAEALAVRRNVGIIDVSTLGGLEVRGPDAAEFLNRMYTFAYLKQPVGRARYLLMTDMSGVITDDGVACRFSDRHFYVTATTSGVQGVYQHMLLMNAQWRLDVDVTNVSASYCGVNIAGPKAREVLARLCTDVDLAAEAFPYMGVRTGTVAGVDCRLLRVGFVGELGYEIHAPASCGEALWDALMTAGADAGIRPFGVEAQRLLRLEKGHIIIGQDTDGLTNPVEAAMAWAISRNKPFFVGGRSIAMQEARGITRMLVGFELTDPAAPVPEECHLVIRGEEITGRVTSAVRSPSLGKVIGLAYVASDQAAEGSGFRIRVAGGQMIDARVVPIPFYDPENKRQEL
ncbi:MAG: glycine cleavage T C-terminal barrel domain-containing protein, partial [Alphaproteobacteria bacterium]